MKTQSHSDSERQGPVYLLWDESQFWGILLWRCLAAWHVPLRLVRAADIARGLLRESPPAALFVPGGWARLKAHALGPEGRRAVNEYLHAGGTYLGICGGAGLALPDNGGLALCPLCRKPVDDRLPNFSGYVTAAPLRPHALVPGDCPPLIHLPVWWPSQFTAPQGPGVEILASYVQPGPDFWVSDLPLEQIAVEERASCEQLYGINLDPELIRGEPCVVSGTLGQGRYILTYAHLESPASPMANSWLGHILSLLSGQPFGLSNSLTAPDWDLAGTNVVWDEPGLTALAEDLESIIRLGTRHFLLFWRYPWLLGWRRGIPGFVLTTLYAQVQTIRSLKPNPRAQAYWNQAADELRHQMRLFRKKMEFYLVGERLAMHTSTYSPQLNSRIRLHEQRKELIGRFPGHGGLFGSMAASLDELVWLAAEPAGHDS
ncbi:biotin--protein ligase [Desulfonatronum thiosulfatophilum]|nr:biotin--protein ligase [Desulfonatronum thiosulfatophilum]